MTAQERANTDRRKVILQVLPRLETGGVERGAVDIAAALAARGDAALVASAGGAMAAELDAAGAEHVTLPMHRKNPAGLIANVARLRRLIRARGVDLVHARSRAPAWSALLAARAEGVPFVTTFHGTYNFRTAAKRAYNSVMARGDRVIAISDFIADHVRRHYGVGEDRLRVVPRGIDLDRFDPEAINVERLRALADRWRLPVGVPVVLLPGRLTRWKGQAVLVEALARLGARPFHALLVGSDQGRRGYRRELEALIAARGLGDRVRIHDDCEDMPAAYMLSDVVVSASTDPEAFGRVASEAQAMGKPVVASAHGGVPEQVLPDETACLVRPGDPDDLARGLAWALSLEAGARARLGVAARRHARHFSLAAMCSKTLAVYDELLDGETAVAMSPRDESAPSGILTEP